MRIGLETDCDYLRTQSLFGPTLELDSLLDARPKGFKAKLEFSIVVEGSFWIRLTDNSYFHSYAIGILNMIDIVYLSLHG